MTTERSLMDSIQNLLDFMLEAELALYANKVALCPSDESTSIWWYRFRPEVPFLESRQHATVSQYLSWAAAGDYSAVLRDGSLLQLQYTVRSGSVSAHRLAYVPCPYVIPYEELLEFQLADLVDLYDGATGEIALKSHIRIDFDPDAAKPGHPAAHLSINNADCRIACAAPMHPHRFLDFIYRNFYPSLRSAHRRFFEGAAKMRMGDGAMTDSEREHPHLNWPIHAAVG